MYADVSRISGLRLAAVLAGAWLLAMGVLLLVSRPAMADERVCRGSIGATTVDNLRVPSGATCKLNGTRAKGTIQVESGARLYAKGVRVVGNVQSEGFRVVSIEARSVIGGNVQLKNGRSGGVGRILSSQVNGDVQFEANRAKMVSRRAVVKANLQTVQNRGGVVLWGNRISQALQCKQNNPAPTGGNNRAGDKEGQCARL